MHLLATPAQAESLARLMQSIGRRYVALFNRRHGRRGTLWDGRFRTSLLDSQTLLLPAMLHIESLPVRAGLVAAPQIGPGRAPRTTAGAAATRCSRTTRCIGAWATRRSKESRRTLVLCMSLSRALEDMRFGEAVAKALALGAGRFCAPDGRIARPTARRAPARQAAP